MKGDIVVNRCFDIHIPLSELSSFPPAIQEHLRIYTYHDNVTFEKINRKLGCWARVRAPNTPIFGLLSNNMAYVTLSNYVEMVNGQEVMVYCADLSKHMNHSNSPNLMDWRIM